MRATLFSFLLSAFSLSETELHIIDQYAYCNTIRQVDPAHKFGLALLVILLCLLLNEPLVGLLAVGWMALLAVRLAGLSPRVFGRVLLAETTFLALTTVGVVLSVSLRDPRAITPWALNIGPLWLSTSPEAIITGLNILLRALGAAAAMNFLALTTPLVDLVELARRWRVPPEIVDLMTVIYRFIFVLLDSLDRMQMAQASRLGYQAAYPRAMNNAALLGSRLFIDAFQRSRRLQLALESRGFSGDLKVLPAAYTHDPRLNRAAVLITITLGLTWLLL